MNLIQAVQELRRKLGDSQQAFANRLGISIRAVANYEKDRQPHGKSLASLARVAAAAGETALANQFRKALAEDIGPVLSPAVDFKSEEERDWTVALLAAFRNPQYSARLRRVQEILEPVRQRCQQKLDDAQEFQAAIIGQMRERLDSGETPQAIIDDLKRRFGAPRDKPSQFDMYMVQIMAQRAGVEK